MSEIILALFAAAPAPAAAPEGWSTKEVLIALGSTVAVLLPIFWGIIEYVGRGYRARITALEGQVGESQKLVAQIDELGDKLKSAQQDRDAASANVTTLSIQLKDQQLKGDDLLKTLAQNEAQYKSVSKGLGEQLEEAKEEAAKAGDELTGVRNRIQKGLDKDSQTWNERVLAGSLVRALPMGPDTRRMPIISVLNLKGGVGKTTVTANLAAALSAKGWRVLMIDLDLQGSLSTIFLGDEQVAILDSISHSLKDMLASAYDGVVDVRDFIRVIEGNHNLGIIPTSDDLAYTESDLLMRWRLREGNKDVRFLLRKLLHHKRVMDNYDIVLLDCPPFVSVGCVNALAASDYILVPVLPSAQATDRVPPLLNRLKEFIANINTGLKVLGIVANRTWTDHLTADEQSRMSALADACKEVLGHKVELFETNIPQNKSIREAEDNHRTLEPGDDLYPAFHRLALEVAGRLPAYCRPKIPAGGVME